MQDEDKTKEQLITELQELRRRHAESQMDRVTDEALRESEHRYRELFEAGSDAILFIDNDSGLILEANGKASAMFGYSREELLTKRNWELSEEPEETRRITQGAKTAPGQVITVPLRYLRRKDGTVFPTEITCRSFLWQKRSVFIADIRDISERKRSEELLKERDVRFKKLSSHIPGMIFQFMKKPNGTYCVPFTTEAIKDIFGCSPPDVREDFSPIARVIFPEDLDRLIHSIESSAEHLTTWQCEYRVQIPGRPIRWMFGQSTPEKLGDGSIMWHGFNTDITERKEAEEAQARLQAQLANALEMAHLGPWEYDVASDLFTFNDHFYKIFRTTASQVGGYTMSSVEYSSRFVHPEDRHLVRKETQKAIETTDPHFSRQLEHRILYGDGTVGHISVRFVIVKDEQGRTIKTYGVNQDITERKQAEEALRLSAVWHRTLVETIPDLVWLKDMKGIYLSCNPTFERFFGAKEEDIVGKTDYDFKDKDLADFFREHDRKALEAGGPSVNEEWLTFADNGYYGLFETIKTPMRDAEGNLIGVLGISRDITQHKQAEEALAESEAHFRAYFELGLIGMAITSPEKGWVQFNDRLCEMLGYPREQLSQMTWAEITHPDDLAADVAQFQRVARGEIDSYRMEKRFIHKDESIIHTELSVKCVRRADGQIDHFVAMVQDIDERKRAEEALRESESFIKAVMDNLPIGVAVNSVHPSVKFVYMNDNFPLKYRTTREKLVDPDAFWDVVYEDPEFREEIKKRVLDDCANGEPERMYWVDVPISRKEDETTYITARNVLVPDKQLMISIVWDVTERKKAEEERRRLEKELRHAHKMEAVGTLAGGIAHEFNNILGIVLGNAELAADDIPDWNPARFNLDEIKSASFRAKDVVRQLLTFSRKAEENRRILDLATVIKEAIKFLRSSIPTNIEFRQDIADECQSVFADPTQMHQILLNLGTNAAHAMEEEGGILEFSLRNATSDETDQDFVSNFEPGEYVMLQVRDTGHGIPVEFLDRIFDPYFTTKEVGKGTGMGLAVVHGIVENHGGTIQVESEPGQGTTIKILFPATKEKTRSFKETKQELPTGTERILFIDDEQSIATLGRLMLERLGYHVQSETDPKKALEVFTSNPGEFDLVITDMTMPGITGDLLIKQVLQIRPDVKTILCTGYSQRIDEESAHSIGAKAYILKPLDRRQLAITVRNVLNGSV